MNHDPLCPVSKWPAEYPQCQCNLIADVIAAAVERVEALADNMDSSAEWCRDYELDRTGNTRNPRVWIREAVATIKGQP